MKKHLYYSSHNILGSLITFTQTSRKLMLAYSSIGIGYVLLVRKYEV